jgi:hypothetical protein
MSRRVVIEVDSDSDSDSESGLTDEAMIQTSAELERSFMGSGAESSYKLVDVLGQFRGELGRLEMATVKQIAIPEESHFLVFGFSDIQECHACHVPFDFFASSNLKDGFVKKTDRVATEA